MFFQWTLLCVRLLLPSILIRSFFLSTDAFEATPAFLAPFIWTTKWSFVGKKPTTNPNWIPQGFYWIQSYQNRKEIPKSKRNDKIFEGVSRKEKALIKIERRSSHTHSSVTRKTSPPLSFNKIFVKLYFQPLCHFSECFVVWCVKRRECNVTSKEY